MYGLAVVFGELVVVVSAAVVEEKRIEGRKAGVLEVRREVSWGRARAALLTAEHILKYVVRMLKPMGIVSRHRDGEDSFEQGSVGRLAGSLVGMES